MAHWSKTNVLDFIEKYRAHECLWKIKSKDYHNREKKEEAYNNLLIFVKKFDEHATRDVVQKKINNLRCTYRKQHKRIKRSQKSGAGVDDVVEPTLWYYKELSFLADHEEALEGVSNLDLG